MTTQPPPYGNQPPQGFGPPPPQYAPTPAQPPAEGPEFMAVDVHNSIVVDVTGVAFEDHGAAVEFSWPEIQSVHYKASPNGKALMMAVVLPNGQFYECVVQAKPRAQLGQWFAQLAAVLGYYRPMGW
ncbi:hypothetical protein [Streptomyces sp. SLBN-31]|jgi:hypothetical protein|uniref:hypothetical protein n=1 Tax=Streptomyces sp. SLBN-31 TaxID=2768444 RepID=UPI00114EBF8A|nr:hypothetical protein [Streptomyces sp. SLBN-31]TQJ74855.1 hypothetical protein FBY22_7866 [Streptomyces sp. SLBN-31]